MTLPREEALPLASPDLGEEEIAEVVATLRSGWLTTGPRVARFEELFAGAVGTRHAVAVGSCTAALHLSLVASGIGPGDEVITTPMTFCATAHAIVHAGARPVFADVETDTGNIDPDAIEAAINPRTAAILPVHLAGRPCRMERIEELARRHGLLLIEDAAHAVGAVWRDRSAGSIGRAGCFSFYATKNIATGEGGMLVTDDAELAGKVRLLAHHGLAESSWSRTSSGRYRHRQALVPGFKLNMTDVQAAIGIHQLARIGHQADRRAAVWSRYDDALTPVEGVLRPAPSDDDVVHGRHLYSVLVHTEEIGKSRDQVLDEMLGHGIGVGVHYDALHLHPYYCETYGYREGDFPVAEHIGARTMSLPLGPKLEDLDVDDVVAALTDAVDATPRADAA